MAANEDNELRGIINLNGEKVTWISPQSAPLSPRSGELDLCVK